MAEETTNPLEELLHDELKDLYSAENQIIKALPKMVRPAISPDLKRAFERHLEETRRQVDRLDQIGEELEHQVDRQEVQRYGRAARRGQGGHCRARRREH